MNTKASATSSAVTPAKPDEKRTNERFVITKDGTRIRVIDKTHEGGAFQIFGLPNPFKKK